MTAAAKLRDDLAVERSKRLAFEKFVREELKHLREQAQHTNAALDLILKAMKVDEEQDEREAASHG